VNVLLIGSGGREHALAWKLKQSPLLGRLHCIPGSAAIAELAACPPVKHDDHDGIYGYCLAQNISLVVIGPEAPLAAGLTDFLTGKGIKVFGPSQKGAMLEASKQFAKEFMERNNIPTAGFTVLFSAAYAREKIAANKKYPVVIKADGLAAGKGVRICADEGEALAAVEDFMDKRIFGSAGSIVVMEEFLTGREASVMALTDGESAMLLPAARDHKRLLDGDKGPNTGGMGAVCPVDISEEDMETVRTEIIQRFLEGLKKERIAFRGVIYAGLMFTPDGPKTLEFNVRFGDPETQAIMPVIKSDLLPALAACAEGRLEGRELELAGGACVTVVAAAAGYPEAPETGRAITGLFGQPSGVEVFHSGTAARDGAYFSAGGRVLSVTARGKDAADARQKAYAALAGIKFEGMQYRKDIGL
jgi:phosphoribosylamine--glycine ligase